MILLLETDLTYTSSTENYIPENIVESQIKTLSGEAFADCSSATAIFSMTENFPLDALCDRFYDRAVLIS